jgi:acetyltransferase-like isoleucine patch superfamily enzyme
VKFFCHPTALVESEDIGSGPRFWAFAHVMERAVIGRECNIGDHSFIETGVHIGDGVVVKNGVSIWSGVTLEDHVFVGPNAVFTNDMFPRARVHRADEMATVVREGASLGANSTIRCGVTVGRWAMVGAGSVVTHDVPDFALVYGVPACLQGWVCACGEPLATSSPGQGLASCECGRSYSFADGRLTENRPFPPPSDIQTITAR